MMKIHYKLCYIYYGKNKYVRIDFYWFEKFVKEFDRAESLNRIKKPREKKTLLNLLMLLRKEKDSF